MVGGALNVANVQITPYSDAAQAQTFEAIDMTGGNAGEDSLLNIADGTIVGPGSAGAGLVVRSNSSVNSGTVTANVHGVVIAGVAESIYRHGKSVTQTANVTIDHSACSGAAVSDGAGNGAIAIGAGNLISGVDPRFVKRSA